MSVTRIALSVPSLSTVNAGKAFERTPASKLKYEALNALIDELAKVVSGAASPGANSGGGPQVSVSVDGLATPASGTVTFATALAADTVTVSGVVFTAVSGAPAANQFDISGTNTQGAASLVAAINNSASAVVPATVIASNVGAIVTIAAVVPGVAGNALPLLTSNQTRLANSVNATGRLAGGVADPTATTYKF